MSDINPKNFEKQLREYGNYVGEYHYTVNGISYRDDVYELVTKKGKERYCISLNGYIKYFRKGEETPSNVHFPFLEEQLREYEKKEEFPPLPSSPEVAEKPTLTKEEISWLTKVTQPSDLEKEMGDFLKELTMFETISELLRTINSQDSQFESLGQENLRLNEALKSQAQEIQRLTAELEALKKINDLRADLIAELRKQIPK